MEKDREIEKILKTFIVHVPDFPMESSKLERISNWLFEKAPYPIPEKKINFQKIVFVQVAPILFSLAIAVCLIL